MLLTLPLASWRRLFAMNGLADVDVDSLRGHDDEGQSCGARQVGIMYWVSDRAKTPALPKR
jgi:hypothetical protein